MAAKDCSRTIAVLAENYLNATYTHSEWAAAYCRYPQIMPKFCLAKKSGSTVR